MDFTDPVRLSHVYKQSDDDDNDYNDDDDDDDGNQL